MNHIDITSSQTGIYRSGYRVDVSRGDNNSRVASEWFSRPDDERFLSLDELYASVRARTSSSETRIINSKEIVVQANRENAERMTLMLPGAEEPVHPTHWSFGQLAVDYRRAGNLSPQPASATCRYQSAIWLAGNPL